LSIVWID